MNASNSSNKRQRKAQPFGLKDWLIVGGGSALAIALLAFALMRKNPTVTQPAATTNAPAQAVTPPHEPGEAEVAAVRRITQADLRSAMDRGEAIVIDVRDLDSYKAGHIAGSYQIPLSAMENEVQYLPRGKTIVTYCT